jgi:hypothetical protein
MRNFIRRALAHTPKFLAEHVVSKGMATFLIAVTAWFIAINGGGDNLPPPATPPVFAGKNWVTDDGEIVFRYRDSSTIDLMGASPEGSMEILIDPNQDLTSPPIEGFIKNKSHGGIHGRVRIDLEPESQIHVRTITSFSPKFKLDLRFRTGWPLTP